MLDHSVDQNAEAAKVIDEIIKLISIGYNNEDFTKDRLGLHIVMMDGKWGLFVEVDGKQEFKEAVPGFYSLEGAMQQAIKIAHSDFTYEVRDIIRDSIKELLPEGKKLHQFTKETTDVSEVIEFLLKVKVLVSTPREKAKKDHSKGYR
ncbi:MAG: hypothetical protein LC122_14000 [Chitinophagales bacterium]|nr:hypothetical protein [Chitinophagales bacterium]